MANIKVSAFRWVPPFAQGLVRDLRVRWALEEAGTPYEARLIGPEDQASKDYRRLQPFGQVPAYEEDGLELFESGAIVLHIAETSEALLPPEPGPGAAKTWMFAALNTIEPPSHVSPMSSASCRRTRRPPSGRRRRRRSSSRRGWPASRRGWTGATTSKTASPPQTQC